MALPVPVAARVAHVGAEPNLSEFSYLVVDATADMRSALVVMLRELGVSRIDVVNRAADALTRIQRTEYDVVLSDYSLVHPYDGMHLLEEVRARNLLKQSAVFIVVTGEARSSNVISAAEQAPDDYLLKPFSIDGLSQRLLRAVSKKSAFYVVDEAMLQHDYLTAMQECDRRLADDDPYMLDFLKLKGRLALLIGDHAEARRTYERVLRLRPIPWAKMGLGKALFFLGEIEVARRVFENVLEDSEQAMEAYDWLAQCLERLGDSRAAQAVLQKAVELSPAVVPRQRRLGEVATDNGDWQAAQRAFTSSIDFARNSFHQDAGDYAQLVSAQLANGDASSAEKTLAEARRSFPSPHGQWLSQVMEAELAHRIGDADRAQRAMAAARDGYQDLAGELPEQYAVEFAHACMQFGEPELASEVAQAVLRNQSEDLRLQRRLTRAFAAGGQAEAARQMIEQNTRDLVELNNTAVRMAQSGDLEGAVHHFLAAVADRPNNLTVTLNAVSALLAYVNRNGWHESYMTLAQDFLARVRALDPANGKCQRLLAQFRALRLQYGPRTA